MLARRHHLPVIASQGTFAAGDDQFGFLPSKVVQAPGSEVSIGGVTVRTFAVSHDAVEPVAFQVEAEGVNVVICTDLGCETPAVREALETADLLVLEANHDVQRLWRGPYHPSLKKRVAGPYGHLANVDTAQLVSELARDGRRAPSGWPTSLAVNNTPALAFDTVTEPLNREGCTHLTVAILARDRPSHTWQASILDPVPSHDQAAPRTRPALQPCEE